MRVLAFETSCDETAVAVVEDGTRILSNVVASQIEIHRRYGGIVPEVASRQHVLSILPCYEEAMAASGVSIRDIDRLAVTHGPGLAGSLLIGVNFARALGAARGLPVYGVNHIEAHIYANWLAFPTTPQDDSRFPALCLIVSGGHTEMHLMRGHGDYRLLGRTRDDAAGEAFDKAARLLGLGYPGGPVIQKAAAAAKGRFALPRAWMPGTSDFSFSGLKTALYHLTRKEAILDDPELVANAAAGFQEAAVEVLVAKTLHAASDAGARSIVVSGGVAANIALRHRLASESPIPTFIPPAAMCTDNAAMVASLGFFRFQNGERAGWDLDVAPGLRLTSG